MKHLCFGAILVVLGPHAKLGKSLQPCHLLFCHLLNVPTLDVMKVIFRVWPFPFPIFSRVALDRAAVLLTMKRKMVRLDNVWGVGGGLRPVKHLVKEVSSGQTGRVVHIFRNDT